MAIPESAVIAAMQASHPYLGPLMVEALLCLCSAADRAPAPPQHCSFRIGNQVVHDIGLNGDICCEGLAYVSMGEIFPSSEAFPEADIQYQASNNCAPLSWGVAIKLGLVRCVPVGFDQNTIPDLEWELAAIQNVYDARTLMAAACCTRTWVTRTSEEFLGMSAVIGSIQQGEPLGGCVERSITVTVQMPTCDCV